MSNRPAFAALIAALTLTAYAAKAVEDQTHRIATDFSRENMICGAYYALVSQCLANDDPKDELIKRYRRASLALVERSVKVGRGFGVSEQALSLEISKRNMMSEIENTCINISILADQHAKRCNGCSRPDRNRSLMR
jgi:hypothetical protein